jgi:hypothetical protein
VERRNLTTRMYPCDDRWRHRSRLDMNDVPVLIEAQEAPFAKRGPHKKKAA